MRLINWSVAHSASIIALYATIIVLALWALAYRIPVRMMPAIPSATLALTTRLPGMPAEQVEIQLTQPIEHELSQLRGIKSLRSTSTLGLSVLTLEFPYGSDMLRARQELEAHLPGLVQRLPAAAEPVRVAPVDPLNPPLLRLALRSSQWDPVRLKEYAQRVLLSRLRSIPGVDSVYLFGGPSVQAEITADRDRLAAFGLSLLDLKRAIDRAGPGSGAGSLARGPDRAMVTLPSFSCAEDLSKVVIAVRTGRPIRIGDVAQIQAPGSRAGLKFSMGSHRNSKFHSRDDVAYIFNGQNAIELNIVQQSQASSPETVAAVYAELGKLRTEVPALEWEEAYNGAELVRPLVHSLGLELCGALLSTGLVILLFLRSWRATAVALLTIPCALSCAILAFVPLGLSLNSSSLVGLLVAVGRLVDDAIVDLHSIQKHLRKGKDVTSAVVEGCGQVRPVIISATMLTCLAVAPLTMVGGITQDMFVGLIVPFALSVAASLLVAMTLTPVLAIKAFHGLNVSPRAPYEPIQKSYARILEWALKRRLGVGLTAVGLCYAAAMALPCVGREMMPLADTGQAYAMLEARPGTSLEETIQMAAQLDQILRSHSEVKKVSCEIGWQPTPVFTGYGVGSHHMASFWISLGDRRPDRPIWTILDQVYSEARASMPKLRRLFLKEMGSDVMANSMAPVEILVSGPELERLSWLAEKIRELAETNPDLVQVGTSWSLGSPRLRLDLDTARLSNLGLSPGEVAEQLRLTLDGGLADSVLTLPGGRSFPIMLNTRASQRSGLASLEGSEIATPSRGRVALRGLVQLRQESGVETICHENMRRVNSVTASVRRGGPGSMRLTMDLFMQSLMSLPYPSQYTLEQRGDMAQMMESFQRLMAGLVISLALIYLALVWQLGSMRLPLALMLAIPLELAGVVVGLLATHHTFSSVSVLGLVILSGIDLTAAVLLADEIRNLRRAGHSLTASVVQASATRLTPILMTVLVTVVVLTPLAFFPRLGMDGYASLGVVIVAGLAVATPLTLLLVPLAYSWIEENSADDGGHLQ